MYLGGNCRWVPLVHSVQAGPKVSHGSTIFEANNADNMQTVKPRSRPPTFVFNTLADEQSQAKDSL